MNLHDVPVLPTPKHKTFIGTVRLSFLLSMSVSWVKMSVTGFGVYGIPDAIFIL